MEKVGKMVFVSLCVFVCLNVCSSIFNPGDQTGPNATTEMPFDAPEWQKDDSADRRVVAATRQEPYAAKCTTARFHYLSLQTMIMDACEPNSVGR